MRVEKLVCLIESPNLNAALADSNDAKLVWRYESTDGLVKCDFRDEAP